MVMAFRPTPPRASLGDSNAKKFQCKLCRYSTNIMTNLRHHLRIHSGERPFRCDTCGKGFIQKIQMIKHSCLGRSRSRRTLSEPTAFCCTQCGEVFPHQTGLYQHLINFHMSR